MGLTDRDYMRDPQRGERSVWGAQEPSASTSLWVMLAFALAAYGGYMAWQWWAATHSTRAPAVAPAIPAGRSPPTHSNLTGNWKPHRPPLPATPAAAAAVVIKCVVNGATTYVASEDDCAPQAKATTVKIDPKQNLSDGLLNSEQIIRQPSPQAQVDVAPAGVDPNVQRQALCQGYEQEIKWIDERARQPLSGQEQDWLAAKRKKARDEQFRLRC